MSEHRKEALKQLGREPPRAGAPPATSRRRPEPKRTQPAGQRRPSETGFQRPLSAGEPVAACGETREKCSTSISPLDFAEAAASDTISGVQEAPMFPPLVSSAGTRPASSIAWKSPQGADTLSCGVDVPASLQRVVVFGSGCGQIFDLMRLFLLEHRGRSTPYGWVDGGEAMYNVIVEGMLPSLRARGRSAAPTRSTSAVAPADGGGASSGAAPCCNRLQYVSLFLGDKLTTERLADDARRVSMRLRRGSSARHGPPNSVVKSGSAFSCAHQKMWASGKFPLAHEAEEASSAQPPAQPATGGPSGRQPVTLLNYIEGLRCITLKSKMVKTFLQHYGGTWRNSLEAFLPMTFQLLPQQASGNRLLGGADKKSGDERVEMVDFMCQSNVEAFEQYGEIATYWIAKSSHGAHGSNIRMFFADQSGLDNLIHFIDTQKDPYPWVVSRYIDRPLLYQQRKFDVRVWVLITAAHDVYVHRELVMRTSSEPYARSNLTTENAAGRLANITNHCVQTEGRQYSRFEEGNELWRRHLDALVRKHYSEVILPQLSKNSDPLKYEVSGGKKGKTSQYSHLQRQFRGGKTASLENCIFPQIKHIVAESVCAARPYMVRPASRGAQPPPTQAFQMLGYDFIIDDRLVVWLLEINGSPGVAQKLIHTLVRDAMELAVDPMFPALVSASAPQQNLDSESAALPQTPPHSERRQGSNPRSSSLSRIVETTEPAKVLPPPQVPATRANGFELVLSASNLWR